MKILRFLAALCVLALPSYAQLIDYRSLGPTYFGSNTIGGVKGIVTGMIGTNAADGSVTNRNQTYGVASLGGTNAVLKLDNKGNNLMLLEGQTNGVSTYKLRNDGSTFIGKYIDQDVDESAFNRIWVPNAVSMVDSNEPSTIGIRGAVLDSEEYGYFSIWQLIAESDKDLPSASFQLESKNTNGQSAAFIISAHTLSGSDFIKYSTNGTTIFSVSERGDLSTINKVRYKWPSTNGSSGQSLTTDGGTPQQLSWSDLIKVAAGTNITLVTNGALVTISVTDLTNVIQILTTNGINQNARIGPGTVNFLPKFISPTNVTDSRVVQPATNWLAYNVLTNWGPITNSWTNQFFGERTDTNNNQGLFLIVQPPAQGLYNELTTFRGSTDARAQNKLLLQKSWFINGVGSGSGADSAGDLLPLDDDTISLGNGSKRVHDFFAGRCYLATARNDSIIYGDAYQGHGFGVSTAGSLYFTGPGLAGIQFNSAGLLGAALLDMNTYGIGFGTSVSNPLVSLRYGGVVGFIGIGTNSSVATPTPVGIGPSPATGTDKGGPIFNVVGGRSTGTGRGGDIAFATARPASGTSSTANTYTTNFVIAANPITLTESSATTVFSVALVTNSVIGMTVTATTEANDGSVYQTVHETFAVSAGVDAAYTPVVSASAPSSTYQRSGTLTTAWTAVQNAGVMDVKCNAVSSLTQTTLRIIGLQITIHTTGTSVITLQ